MGPLFLPGVALAAGKAEVPNRRSWPISSSRAPHRGYGGLVPTSRVKTGGRELAGSGRLVKTRYPLRLGQGGGRVIRSVLQALAFAF